MAQLPDRGRLSYRVAIVGCRDRGPAAGMAYHAHPRTEVVGLCDLVPERTAALSERLGTAAPFADVDEMLAAVRPDVAVVATRTDLHFQLARNIIEQGVHVDVEKPICVDLAQADRLEAAARNQGVRLAVHHQTRGDAPMRAMEQAVAEGRIGDVRYAYGSCQGLHGGYGLMYIGTHILSNMLAFTGPCRTVSALGTTAGRPIEPGDVESAIDGMGTVAGDRLTASLQFDHGVTATLLQHQFEEPDSTAYAMELFGTKGRLFWKRDGAWLLDCPHFVPDGKSDRWTPLALEYPSLLNADSDLPTDDFWFADEFVKALDEDRDHLCSGAAALQVLEIIMAIFESATCGEVIHLPQENREHPLARWRESAGLGRPKERLFAL